MLKRRPHTPAHLLLDDTPYFITGAIRDGRRLLDAELKWALIALIKAKFAMFDWELHHWVVLDNHYHLLGRSSRGQVLPRLMQQLHAESARWIRSATGCALPVWWNYWDYCPRGERDYEVRLNYLLNNPLKHGYVEDLRDYPFSSFPGLYEQQGREALARRFRGYGEYRSLRIAEDDF